MGLFQSVPAHPPARRRWPIGLPFTVGAGKSYTYCTTTSWTGNSLQESQSPAVAVGDAFIYDSLSTPGGYAITVAGDGTVIIASGGDTSRQSFVADIWDRSLNALYGSFTVYVNDSSPALGTVATQAWAVGATTAYDLPITDADDALSALTLIGTLPTGVTTALHTYNPGPSQYQRWRLEYDGTGSGAASGNITDLRVTDVAAAFAIFASFAWTRVDGIQIPSTASGTLTYAAYLDLIFAAGLIPSTANLVLNGSVTPGNVTSTSPAYPTYVAPGSVVIISVSALTVPNVVGLTQAAALTALAGYAVTAPGAGIVIAQSLAAGTLVLPGAAITLTMSTYSAASLTVIAYRIGHFGGLYRIVDDQFEITAPQQYSPYWMTLIDAPPSDWIPLMATLVPAIDREIATTFQNSEQVQGWVGDGVR